MRRSLISSFVLVATIGTVAACHDGTPTITQPQVEAGAAAADGLCSLFEGIEDSGVIRTICATAEEVAQIVSFVLTLRKTQDAGAPNPMMVMCTPLPESNVCATRAEIAKGILFVANVRQRRLMREAGAVP